MNALKVRLVKRNQLSKSGHLLIGVEVENRGKDTLLIDPLSTSVVSGHGDLFLIQDENGRALEFEGAWAIFPPADSLQGITIRPGEILSEDVQLTRDYSLHKPGCYRIALRRPQLGWRLADKGPADFEDPDAFTTQDLSEVIAELDIAPGFTAPPTISSIIEKPAYEPENPEASAGPGFLSPPVPSFLGTFSNQQKATLKAEHKKAYQLIETGLSGLANDAKYKRWFGIHTTTRFNYVKKHLKDARNSIKNKAYVYDSRDDPPFGHCNSADPDPFKRPYAWVKSTQERIYTCNEFWKLPERGLTIAGTIAHEIVHVVDSDILDIYGSLIAEAAKILARQEPENAIKNAPNYQFYLGG